MVSKYAEFQIFCGENFNSDASLAFSFTPDGEENPVFYYLNPGMKAEKY